MQEPIKIEIIEPKLAPMLYAQSNHTLNASGQPEALKTGLLQLGYEGNTTEKDIGLFYLCDINRKDNLELHYQNKDGNVTYTMTEVTMSETDSIDNGDTQVCLDANLRYDE